MEALLIYTSVLLYIAGSAAGLGLGFGKFSGFMTRKASSIVIIVIPDLF